MLGLLSLVEATGLAERSRRRDDRDPFDLADVGREGQGGPAVGAGEGVRFDDGVLHRAAARVPHEEGDRRRLA